MNRYRGFGPDGVAETEADHFMKCPGCGQLFDMRDMSEVMEPYTLSNDVTPWRPSPKGYEGLSALSSYHLSSLTTVARPGLCLWSAQPDPF